MVSRVYLTMILMKKVTQVRGKVIFADMSGSDSDFAWSAR